MNSFFGNPLVRKIQNWKENSPLSQDEWEQKAIKSLVKKLKGKGGGERAVKELEKALATRDKQTKCVTIPRSVDGRLQISSKKGLPHVIYCRIFRFPDLLSHTQLRSADTCANGYHARKPVVCVNPFHYDRTPGPPILNPVLVPSAPPGITYSSHRGTPATSGTAMDTKMPLDLVDLELDSPFSAKSEGGSTGSKSSRGSTDSGAGSSLRNSGSAGSSHSSSDSASSSVAWNLETPESQNSFFGFLTGDSAVDSYFYDENDGYQTGSFYQAAAGGAPLTDQRSMRGTFSVYSSAELQLVSPLSADYQRQMGVPAQTAPVSYVEPEFWSSVTYMEMALRVGETFHASLPILTVDGYTDPTCHDRFCVGLLSNVIRDSVTENVRRHIGKGLRLCYVGGEVFVECESESAVFVQSTNYNERNNLEPNKVVKVAPGSTLMIFNNQEFAAKLANSVYDGFEAVYKLIANCNVRISFVKGWGGPFYQRPDVKHTPCWIDVTLNGPLQWLDKVLTQMGSPSSICTSYS